MFDNYFATLRADNTKLSMGDHQEINDRSLHIMDVHEEVDEEVFEDTEAAVGGGDSLLSEDELREQRMTEVADRLRVIGDGLDTEYRLRRFSLTGCQGADPHNPRGFLSHAFHEISRAVQDLRNNNGPFYSNQSSSLTILRVVMDTTGYLWHNYAHHPRILAHSSKADDSSSSP